MKIPGLCRYFGCSCTIAAQWQSLPISHRNRTPKRLAKSSLDRPNRTTDIAAALSMPMRIGRTILAIITALSVAILPAAGGVGLSSKSPAQEDMSMTTEDMHDCCPHKANPCDKADDCGTMATCALKCFSFAGTPSSIFVFPSTFAKMTMSFAVNPFSSQTGTAPFRPPRA